MTQVLMGQTIARARRKCGLTQAQLAAFAGVSRATINYLEHDRDGIKADTLFRVMNICGLSVSLNESHGIRNGLKFAAQTSNVSYKSQLTPETLQKCLATGIIDREIKANLIHFFDECPDSLVVKAIRETAKAEKTSVKNIWNHARKMAVELQTTNQRWLIDAA
jgi:transcriptional regulator with XRE-family HTH domain